MNSIILKMWTKLISTETIAKNIVPRIKNGIYIQPLIYGRKKAELRKMFLTCGLPWVYKDPEIHSPSSPYNRGIKPSKNDKHFLKRIEQIKRNIKLADQKELQFRKDRATKLVKPVGLEKQLLTILVSMGMKDRKGKKKKAVKKQKQKTERSERSEKNIFGPNAKGRKPVLSKTKPTLEDAERRATTEIKGILTKV